MKHLNEPIRILQVGMSPNYGGTEAFIMEQYRHIDKRKVQFDFLNVFKEELACTSEIKDLGGRIYYLDMARHNGIGTYYEKLDEFFKKNSKQIDGIHCNCQSLINIDLLKYAKKYNVPIRIIHAHNAGYGQRPSFVQKLIILINKLTVKKYATHFFACSELAAKWMFPKNIQTTVIHNAIESRKFKFNENTRISKRADLNISSDTFVVLFVGRLDPQKNPLYLIEIFEKIAEKNSNSLLLVAGDGYMRGKIETLIEKKGLEDKVKLLGNRNDINELMQAADAFLLPSKFEGLGIVLIEAQAASLPCYTSKDVVPEEVDITNTVKFISLKSLPQEWARIILESSSATQVREDKYFKICNSGYNSEKCILEETYLQHEF